jgi:hypothetical protein
MNDYCLHRNQHEAKQLINFNVIKVINILAYNFEVHLYFNKCFVLTSFA